MRRAFLIGALCCVAAFAAPSAHAAANIPLDNVRRAMVGTWQSLDDTRFTRELDANGIVTDRYEGNHDDAIKGNWNVFAGNAPPPEAAGRKLVPTAVYLELRQNGDILFFGLAGLTAQSLRMIYLERGNQLAFTRLK